MIIEEYDESLFIQRFENMKRVETADNPNGNFSYRGLRALFEYLDEAHDEENPLKLDVISLCCNFSEYKNLAVYLNDYKNCHEDTLKEHKEKPFTKGELLNKIWEELQEQTSIVLLGDDLDDGFIIQQY